MNLVDFLRQGGTESRDPAMNLVQQLAFVKKYDPNASLSMDTRGDNGPVEQLNYDQRLLPKYADGTTYGQVDSSGHQLYTPIVGPSKLMQSGVSSFSNPNDIWSDPNYGMVTHSGNININEKRNRAQQTTLLDTLGPLLVGGIAGFAGMPSILTALMKQFANPGGGPLAAIMQLLQGQQQKPGG